jgi:hypothetical protein
MGTRLFQIYDRVIKPGDPPEMHDDNYWAKVQRLVNAGVITGAQQTIVLHDDWCAWYNNNDVPCNCDPDIKRMDTGELPVVPG